MILVSRGHSDRNVYINVSYLKLLKFSQSCGIYECESSLWFSESFLQMFQQNISLYAVKILLNNETKYLYLYSNTLDV